MPVPEDAMSLASRRVAAGDIRVGTDEMLRLRPRIIVIQDSDQGLVIAGMIRAGIVLWQQPVASDAEARRVVTEASKLRGAAFTASGRGEHASAREHRYRASQRSAVGRCALARDGGRASANAAGRLTSNHAFPSIRPGPAPGFPFQEPDMANYLTHFSCLLNVGTPENAARALELYNKLSEEGASEEPPSEGFLLSIEPQYGGPSFGCAMTRPAIPRA